MAVTKTKTRKFAVYFDHKLCKRCQLCAEICPANILELDTSKDKMHCTGECRGCHRCEQICPDFAVRIDEVES